MRKIWLPIVLLLVAGAIFAITEAGQEYLTIQLVVPEGDPSAGRAAFLELSCTSCHAVAGDPELLAPISANPGPTLGPIQAAHARSDAGSIASSIVSPSHIVVEDLGAEVRQRLSPMGDFSDAMTIRQLVDLVAYLAETPETEVDSDRQTTDLPSPASGHQARRSLEGVRGETFGMNLATSN